MKIKKGDNVIVIAGKDRGKTGAVLRALPREDRVVVEGVNVRKCHERPRKNREKGQIIEKTLPVHVSNVMLVDPKGAGRTRVGITRSEGKPQRIARKSGTLLDR